MLSVRDLNVVLADNYILQNLNIEVLRGEKVTLSGPSGSGKSTFLKCLVGFLPFQGIIKIKGQELGPNTVWKIRKKVAYVPQDLDLGTGLVKEVLMRPFMYYANKHLTYREEEVEVLFERFMLSPRLMKESVANLSGGERQRIGLIISLLLKRQLLLLDEVSSALDKTTKHKIKEYLCEQKDITIVSVSHDTRDFSLNGKVLDINDLKKDSF